LLEQPAHDPLSAAHRQRVHRLTGEATVASRMGEGAEFTIRLAAIEVEGP
jgi:hypothetical protein